MKKTAIFLACALIAALLVGCAPEESKEKSDNPLMENRVKLLEFDYGDVTLTDGIFKDTYESAADYYLGLSVDDMLYGQRKAVLLDTGAGKDLGGFGAGGNVLGQWIQGNARYCAALGTPELKARVTELCDGLYEISKVSPLFNDGKSMYSFEKYLRGCLDLYTLCGLEKGLEMAQRMVDAVKNDPAYANAEKRLGDNGSASNPQEIEWYTIAESLYAFADALKAAGRPAAEVKEYARFAAEFEYKEFWNIFYENKNFYDYRPVSGQNIQHFHAYSHLNSFNSAGAAYGWSGNDYYVDSMIKFYDFMRAEQESAPGGYGAHTEWLLPREDMVDALQKYHDSYENQCDTYAVYRLGNKLAGYTGEAKYGDWSEKLLYNSTIASLETEDGYAFYYSDFSSAGGQKNLRYDWRWACCAGSRPLTVNEVLKTIYYQDTRNLYVNLFVNSKAEMKNAAGGTIVLTQQSDFPESDTIVFTVEPEQPSDFSVKFRKPEWLSGKAQAKVNGQAVGLSEDECGWLVLSRTWEKGDTIELTLPSSLTVSKMEYEADYGKEGVFAIMHGPVALAASMQNPLKDPADVLDGNGDIAAQLKEEGPLAYTALADETLAVKPFYRYKKQELYFLYMNLYQY
ncbi:hypothetical protein ESZ91_06510 [Candidatus Borkfalkia ceftriaxoniphila]|uniref:Glycoside hydrolase family 127 protein n=1 Tax=Candidatus Borkfalkia ceftriaxoniphila TaxID=2508949 RepID=A0A4Q2KBS5_9FIRM|nr:beta-L-arabinofuranosidase domain-containing protein [Candidatus Borkfalkia ceftriaxoniphila]RXZ62038.1 hypothetical protein ESZ91_06510 [Candidatus Borkfalkia ceftriaxoniphila]